MICNICPRSCNAARYDEYGTGFCGAGTLPKIALAAPHFGEEPCVSGTRGSGTVFFSSCNLRCRFCQNHEISLRGAGKTVSAAKLIEIYASLTAQGVHNINLVTGSHYVEAIAQSLSRPLSVPVIWNTSGYESAEQLRLLDGKIQIYLPDFKYAFSDIARKYSNAPDYPEIAKSAIIEMYRQTGDFILDGDGLLCRGVLIRHLILPGNPDNTKRVIDWVSETFKPGQVLFSLMSQYTPVRETGFPELSRTITDEEYRNAVKYLEDSKIDSGFYQDPPSESEAEWIPEWDY